MLQQTQVDRVIPKYKLFLQEFPTFASLAKADAAAVLKIWQGLGYNRRALALKRAAETIVHDFKGVMPQTLEELVSLPGVGLYTAAAVAAFAFNRPEVLVETNIRTVYIHHFFAEAEQIHDKDLLPLIEQTLDRTNPREWYWALMDYGSHLKKQHTNPARRSRHYYVQKTFQGSNRRLRGMIIKKLVEKSPRTMTVLTRDLPYKSEQIQKAMSALRHEGLLRTKGQKVWLG